MSNRRIAVIVGILFFFQLITFMIGSSLIEQSSVVKLAA